MHQGAIQAAALAHHAGLRGRGPCSIGTWPGRSWRWRWRLEGLQVPHCLPRLLQSGRDKVGKGLPGGGGRQLQLVGSCGVVLKCQQPAAAGVLGCLAHHRVVWKEKGQRTGSGPSAAAAGGARLMPGQSGKQSSPLVPLHPLVNSSGHTLHSPSETASHRWSSAPLCMHRRMPQTP